MALALEKVNLHKRIALSIIKITGTTPNKVVLGFMIATAALNGFTKSDQNFALSVMLGIAFSANAGGIATVIGTPPNSVMIGLLENEYNIQISFLKWMVIGVPFSTLMIAISYFVCLKMFPNKQVKFTASKDIINSELQKLGPYERKRKNGVNTSKLAWGILILFGGGLALAKGMSVSGIVDVVSNAIATSDIIAVLAPVVAGIAIGLEIPILYLLIPVTMASSCAFMLPMATPPNAIVFASGYIKVHEMARVGIILNLIAVGLLVVLFQFVIPLLF
ncbi:Sodium-dependent dicarboxylate transporter SdcS [Nymphon striatum]|nr:Sodium-dependent dicarboxylate transporter SdcS [Nymphon striatum]